MHSDRASLGLKLAAIGGLLFLHLPILLTLLHLFSGQAPLPALLAATVVLSVIAAGLSYRWIESPAIAFARKVTQPRPVQAS